MKRLLLVMSTLLLCLTPAHGAGGKQAQKPSAGGTKPAAEAPRSPSDRKALEDPELRAKFDKLGPLMTDIGEEAAMIAGGKSKGLFLYAEMKGKRATVFVFRDRGKTVMRYAETERLRELVEQAWALEPAGKRWAILAYEGFTRTFDARMVYPEEVDPKQPVEERILSLMPRGFDGKKLVVAKELGREAPEAEAPSEPVMPPGLWS